MKVIIGQHLSALAFNISDILVLLEHQRLPECKKATLSRLEVIVLL